MDLHEHLRELVARQGPDVVESAEVFRAALDDYLSEDEATTGELNLLVDAVRLGAVARLGSVLDHGAAPAAAVVEAGDTFARDRGTDDAPRCRWAVAAVGYALGRLEAGDVPGRDGVTGPPPSLSAPPAPPAPRPTAPVTAATPGTFPVTEDLAPPPPSPAPAVVPARRRGRTSLAVLLVGVVVAGAILLGMRLGSRDDDPEGAADGDGFAPLSSLDPDQGTEQPPDGTLSDDTVLVPVTGPAGETRIYAVDVESGTLEPMTDGPDDRVPVISPDRRTLLYSELTATGGFRPMVKDLASGKVRRLFVTPGGCEYSSRPAFHPDGDRLALFCTDARGDHTAAYVVDLRGGFVATIPAPGEPQGTPTWVSDTAVVFAVLGATDSDPTTLWQAEVDGDEAVPLTDGSEGWDTHPDWSEEAGLLVFSRHPGAPPYGDLLSRGADGAPGPAAEGVLWGHPAWSPDGTRVVVSIKDGGSDRLHVVSLEDDGFSDPVPLAEPPGQLGVPAWGSR